MNEHWAIRVPPHHQSSRRHFLVGSAALGAATLAPSVQARAVEPALTETFVPGSPVPGLAPKEVTAPASVAKLGDVHLWYWDTGGNGDAIVLMHPATGSGHVWGYQQEAFANAGYRVIGYSRRGFRGSSSGSPDQRGTGAGDLARLLDYLAIERAHLLGSAAGGFIAGAFAIEAPERVRSLTIACSIVSIADPAVREMVPWLYEAWWNELPEDLRELSPSYRAVNRAGHARWLELHHQSREGATPVNQPPGSSPATLETLARIPSPTLLISGDADLISPPPIARALARTIPDSRLTILSECGHSAYWERPDAFNTAILEFIEPY
jgi:pimeloyl-ACP methyl ester carboxylesterase